jgi:hypothetical protein
MTAKRKVEQPGELTTSQPTAPEHQSTTTPPQSSASKQLGTSAGRNGDSPTANQPGDGFPLPMTEEAFHGIAGRVCSILEEENETCREALLAQVIVGFGNLVGQGPRTVEENFLNEFVLIIGDTSSARKGTSLRYALDHLRRIDPDWDRAVRACPPSGEGIVWHLRDARELKGGKVDPGISEKRAFFRAEEFSRIMASIASGGTLSQRLRECWDHHNPLENLTKIDPIRASNTHISLVAHCTPFEFAQCVRTAEQRNGFINRFLIVAARGVKAVPRPRPIDWAAHSEIVSKLREIVNKNQKTTTIGFTNRAAGAWDQWYVGYRKQKLGFTVAYGEMVGRCEGHVKRLAAIYAVLDGKKAIDEVHLNAALAFWRYCADSVTWAFPATENRVNVPIHAPAEVRLANTILDALKASPTKTLTRSQISRALGNNKTPEVIGRALALLLADKLAEPVDPTKPKKAWKLP